MKIYFKTYQDEGGVYFKNKEHNIIVRFAGKPKFILEKYIEKYGQVRGKELYSDLLDILYSIDKSPIVAYLYSNDNNNAIKKEKNNNSKERKENDNKSNG